MFTLTIETTGASFGEGNAAVAELQRILRQHADALPVLAPVAAAGVPVIDSNGNTCGRWSYVPERVLLASEVVADIIAAYDRIVTANTCEAWDAERAVADDEDGDVLSEVVETAGDERLFPGDYDRENAYDDLGPAVAAYRHALRARIASRAEVAR